MQGYYYIKVDRHAVKIGEVASFSKAVAILLMTFYVSVNDMKTQKEFQRIYADVSSTCDTLGISCSVAQGRKKIQTSSNAKLFDKLILHCCMKHCRGGTKERIKS